MTFFYKRLFVVLMLTVCAAAAAITVLASLKHPEQRARIYTSLVPLLPLASICVMFHRKFRDLADEVIDCEDCFRIRRGTSTETVSYQDILAVDFTRVTRPPTITLQTADRKFTFIPCLTFFGVEPAIVQLFRELKRERMRS